MDMRTYVPGQPLTVPIFEVLRTAMDLRHIWVNKSMNLDYIWMLKRPADLLRAVWQAATNPSNPVALLQAPSFPSPHHVYPTRSMWVTRPIGQLASAQVGITSVFRG